MGAVLIQDFQQHGPGSFQRLRAQAFDEHAAKAAARNGDAAIAQHFLQVIGILFAGVDQPLDAGAAHVYALLFQPLFQLQLVAFHLREGLGNHPHALGAGLCLRGLAGDFPQGQNVGENQRHNGHHANEQHPQKDRHHARDGCARLAHNGAVRHEQHQPHAKFRHGLRRIAESIAQNGNFSCAVHRG